MEKNEIRKLFAMLIDIRNRLQRLEGISAINRQPEEPAGPVEA